ncbi:MAG: DGQHR domain-containing protein [Aquiluna sp.]|nr:DGQHR domain-containing protein [Aquiluna sp.]MCF8545616.1 DGQHR domain-containing protein [Aquiluna sp.]
MGFERLDNLADISSADVFDQVDNKFGTQRELKSKHAREAGEYALGSGSSDSLNDPRAFTAVILNVRDLSLVRVFHEGAEINISSSGTNLTETRIVDVEIDRSQIIYPQPKFNPQISRVDGNHRLSAVPAVDERENLIFPTVPFDLFVGLSTDQERKLFRDINGTQVKMNTAHLAQIHISLEGDGALLDNKSRSIWLAKRLAGPGFAFQDMVYMGGAKVGLKNASGSLPPINLNSLDSMMKETLRGLETLQVELFPEELIDEARAGDSIAFEEIVQNGEKLATLLNRFWLAVRNNFPEAWQDKKNHILLQSIGLMGTSKFATEVIRDLISEHKVDQPSFDMELKKLVSVGFNFDKSNYSGFAGGAGASKVFVQLVEKRVEGKASVGPVLGQL